MDGFGLFFGFFLGEAFELSDFSKRPEIDYQCTMVASDTLELYTLENYKIVCKNDLFDRNENCQLEIRIKRADESPEDTFRTDPQNDREQLRNRLKFLKFFSDMIENLLNLVDEF